MKYPLLSIIVPIYNMQLYLEECLASLRKQGFSEEVEILLIDDGSTDKSSSMCDETARIDKHFRVIHQQNLGIAAARNRGLEESRGKYIAWVDPDDYVTDDWWQVIKPVLENEPDMVYFDMYTLTDFKLKEIHFDNKSRIIDRKEWIQELANGNRIMSHLWSKIILRTFFDHNKTFNKDYSYCEDYEALHRITWPVRECIYLHNSLYIYRQRAQSFVHDNEKIISNAMLSIQLNYERANFYKMQNIDISNFGILYSKLLYCLAYYRQHRKRNLTQHERYIYEQSKKDLKRNWHFLSNSQDLQLSMKIRLFLLLHNILFIEKIFPFIKNFLSRK